MYSGKVAMATQGDGGLTHCQVRTGGGGLLIINPNLTFLYIYVMSNIKYNFLIIKRQNFIITIENRNFRKSRIRKMFVSSSG